MLWTRIVGQVCKITYSISEHFNITDQYININNKVQVEHPNFKRSTIRNIVTWCYSFKVQMTGNLHFLRHFQTGKHCMLFFLQEHFFAHLLRHLHFLNVFLNFFLNIALESFVSQMGIILSSMILQPQSSGDSTVAFVIWTLSKSTLKCMLPYECVKREHLLLDAMNEYLNLLCIWKYHIELNLL